MKMLAYGEDALTLWAVNKRLPFILQKLNDLSPLSDCRVIFRPSFGRSGGENSAQFGEFDFIILSTSCLYLGESKWDRSSERIHDGSLTLRDEQLLRHRLFKFYVREWASGKYESWQEFVQKASYMLRDEGITKLLAPPNSLLAQNLETILSIIREHYHSNTPQLKNVLMYFHIGADADRIPKAIGNDFEIFEVIDINYSEIAVDQFIEFDWEMENKSSS
jgi:hypothetical protein